MNIHPGAVLKEYIDTQGWSQREFAAHVDMTPKTVSQIINGKADIKPWMAVRFEKVLERPAHFWMNLQTNYDLERERGENG